MRVKIYNSKTGDLLGEVGMLKRRYLAYLQEYTNREGHVRLGDWINPIEVSTLNQPPDLTIFITE
jgi:hypothetical protein